MAIQRETFRTRTLSAAVFVVVMLAGLLINHWTFFILFSVIHFGCWWEYQRIVCKIDPGYQSISSVHRFAIMLAGWSLMLWFTNNDFHIGGFSLHSAGRWLVIFFVLLAPAGDGLMTGKILPKNMAHSFLGLIYISLSFALLIDLLIVPGVSFSSSPVFPILIISCMWINDTMAYIVGSLIGKTPFSSISPKKTWEGTIGGIVLCVVVVSVASRFIWWLKDYPAIHFVCIAAIAAVAGTVGDLLESKLKRMADVKDSGSIMPGHGGFLDRFDSLLVATPFVWLYVRLFLRLP